MSASDVVAARVFECLPLVRMVCWQIKKQLSLPVDVDELASYGNEGLLRAARSFDPSRGVPFRRWANLRVRGAVLDGVRNSALVPRSVYERLRAAEQDDARSGGASETQPSRTPEPCDAEEADRRLDEYLATAATAVALSMGIVQEEGSGPPLDRGADSEELLLRQELMDAVRDAVRALPRKERTLVQRHYFAGVTFNQAAGELGLSKSWGSRLHARAIGMIMRRLRRQRLL